MGRRLFGDRNHEDNLTWKRTTKRASWFVASRLLASDVDVIDDTTIGNNNNNNDNNLVVELEFVGRDENENEKQKQTQRRVTLIGTAHLSKQSNELVEDVIESVQPDVVVVELDRTRLERIGLTEVDLGKNFVTADDIQPPLLEEDISSAKKQPWWKPATDFFLNVFSQLTRKLLTGMYEDMGQNMGGKDELMGGGEFLVAIQTAKRINNTTKIVLGDRSSIVTIQRAAQLAIRSGDAWGVMNRLNTANQEEMEQLEVKVRKQLLQQANKKSDDNVHVDDDDDMEAKFNVAMVETIKSDASFRNRLFERLERDVPEFTQAFLTERDYIMAEAILREIDANHIVAVVGLGHVPGMANNLRNAGYQDYNRL